MFINRKLDKEIAIKELKKKENELLISTMPWMYH